MGRALLAKLPAGSALVAIENIEGVILAPGRLRGASGRDTSGTLVVDTGAGYLGIDRELALILGVSDSSSETGTLQLGSRPLPRLELGTMQLDQVSPVLLIDADVIRRVTGRDVMGLAGQSVFAGHAIWIDYSGERMICVPSPPNTSEQRDWPGEPERSNVDAGGRQKFREITHAPARANSSHGLLAPLLSPAARAVPFRLAGDHKILVRARLGTPDPGASSEWLTLVFDTGATKSCLFEPALSDSIPASRHWRSITGIVAPTLIGDADARLTIVPAIQLEGLDMKAAVRRTQVDCAVITTDLAAALSAAVGEPVMGLLGYSFFKGYRVAIDYPNRTLWLDPDPNAHDDHPNEYSHVGIQLERDGDRVRVVGVASGSPAMGAGIAVGDTLVAIGSTAAKVEELIQLTDMLEGAPGTRVRITLRHAGVQRTYRLQRRRLL